MAGVRATTRASRKHIWLLKGVGRCIGASLATLGRDARDFVPLAVRVNLSVEGWLRLSDAYFLYEVARRGPGHGSVVEIGSAFGKSTIFLAAGSKAADREKVYAIDPHTGPEASSFDAFMRNMRTHGLESWVTPVVSTSVEAARSIDTGPIRLLYVDGLHTYEGVRADIADWIPKVVGGGVIVFDDYESRQPTVDVRRAVDELLASGLVENPLRHGCRHVWTTKTREADDVTDAG